MERKLVLDSVHRAVGALVPRLSLRAHGESLTWKKLLVMICVWVGSRPLLHLGVIYPLRCYHYSLTLDSSHLLLRFGVD